MLRLEVSTQALSPDRLPAIPAIEVAGLRKAFGTLVAVDGLNLVIPEGCIFGFLGPNGSGKTTTVRMLTGLLLPDAGEVRVGGLSLAETPLAVKNIIGVLPDGLGLFDGLTIWDHLLLAGALYGLSAETVRARAAELLESLDLFARRDTPVESASYGMRKKTALAMALIHAPRVLFLDEPFEGLDPLVSQNVKELLLKIARRGVTVFITSHMLPAIHSLIDRFAIIRQGSIVFQARMGELHTSLENIYLEQFERRELSDFEWYR